MRTLKMRLRDLPKHLHVFIEPFLYNHHSQELKVQKSSYKDISHRTERKEGLTATQGT